MNRAVSKRRNVYFRELAFLAIAFALFSSFADGDVPKKEVEGQPLGANITRLVEALDYVGHALPQDQVVQLRAAAKARDAEKLQSILDAHVLFVVSLNPEVRVKVARGPAKANLQQAGFTPHIVKILNDSSVTRELRITSPQSGPVYSGASEGILKRQAQTELNENANLTGAKDRFIEVEMLNSQPMTRQLSGLSVEYALALIYCDESGNREATIAFNVGDGTQDIGFRGELPVLFDVAPAKAVSLRIRDFDDKPTTARLTFRDKLGHVYPPQLKRLAPDFFFQPQIYRADGETVLLPPGEFELTSSRGPEYVERKQSIQVSQDKPTTASVQLQRWINPRDHGYCGGIQHR